MKETITCVTCGKKVTSFIEPEMLCLKCFGEKNVTGNHRSFPLYDYFNQVQKIEKDFKIIKNEHKKIIIGLENLLKALKNERIKNRR